MTDVQMFCNDMFNTPDPNRDAMNYSNASYDRNDDKVDRIQGEPQDRDTQLDGGLKAPPMKNAPGTQLQAASALTSLKPDTEIKVESDDDDGEFQIPLRFTKSGRKRATPFPMKLMKVLSTKKYSHIISWTQDGKSFTILRPKAFATEVLPKFFKESKYSSFTRKLHRWGFQRHLRGSETGSFFNKNFQRGRPDLLDKMACFKNPREHHHPLPPMSTFAAMPQQDALMLQAHLMNQTQRPMMPSPEMIAEAQATLRRQQLGMMQIQQMQAQQMQEQLMQAQQQPSRVPDNISDEDRLNAAIELEVTRRLQDRVQAASLSRQALAMFQQQQEPSYDGMQASASFAQASSPQSFAQITAPPSFAQMQSPARRQVEMNVFEKTLAARMQQAAALRLAVRGLEDSSTQQYFDANMEGARGA